MYKAVIYALETQQTQSLNLRILEKEKSREEFKKAITLLCEKF